MKGSAIAPEFVSSSVTSPIRPIEIEAPGSAVGVAGGQLVGDAWLPQ